MTFFSDDEIACIAGRARVLSEPTRVRILDALARGEYTVSRLATVLGLDESALSEHLQVLFSAGLVQQRREAAAATLYRIEADDLIDVCHVLGRRKLHRVAVARRPMDAAPDAA
jgi:DNA-binding transcriptional ArsR family regulator